MNNEIDIFSEYEKAVKEFEKWISEEEAKDEDDFKNTVIGEYEIINDIRRILHDPCLLRRMTPEKRGKWLAEMFCLKLQVGESTDCLQSIRESLLKEIEEQQAEDERLCKLLCSNTSTQYMEEYRHLYTSDTFLRYLLKNQDKTQE